MASRTIGITFKSSAGLWKRRVGSFSRSTSRRTTSGCGRRELFDRQGETLMLISASAAGPGMASCPVSIFQSVTPSE